MSKLDIAATGAAGSKYCAPGATVTPDISEVFAYVVAIGGTASISAHVGSNCDSLPATFAIPEGVDYPIRFKSISVAGGSSGGVVAVEIPLH